MICKKAHLEATFRETTSVWESAPWANGAAKAVLVAKFVMFELAAPFRETALCKTFGLKTAPFGQKALSATTAPFAEALLFGETAPICVVETGSSKGGVSSNSAS